MKTLKNGMRLVNLLVTLLGDTHRKFIYLSPSIFFSYSLGHWLWCNRSYF